MRLCNYVISDGLYFKYIDFYFLIGPQYYYGGLAIPDKAKQCLTCNVWSSLSLKIHLTIWTRTNKICICVWKEKSIPILCIGNFDFPDP